MARFLLGFLGVLLLLPGLCSAVFMAMAGSGGAGSIWILWLITFAIGWGGFVLLRKAWRG